jgi:hypothetical protein
MPMPVSATAKEISRLDSVAWLIRASRVTEPDLGEFDGIRQEVEEDLFEPHLVTDHAFAFGQAIDIYERNILLMRASWRMNRLYPARCG